MKVFAINSSARVGVQSKTEMILDLLVKGMEEEGADVEIANIFKKKINYCIGCYTCWTKTPGICIHNDDMSKELFPKSMACDMLVMATPLFHFTVNANMKAFIERTLPFVLPFFERRNGVTRHPLRQVPPPVVAVSVAGFPEHTVFNQLSSYLNHLYKSNLKGEVYIPAAETLARNASGPKAKTVLDAVVQGGRELVKDGKISDKTMALINTPTIDFEKFAPLGNMFWQTCIDEGVTPREFYKLGLTPRPKSMESFLAIMEMGFNPDKAAGFNGSYQFNFTGGVEGACYLHIKNGMITTGLGACDSPDVSINTGFEMWMDIMARKTDGQQMFMEQKYQVEGDISYLMKMSEVFG